MLNIDWLNLTVWITAIAMGIASWVGIGYGLTLLWETL